MNCFILTSIHETDRLQNVERLQQAIPGSVLIEAIYPRFQKIPFLNKLIEKSRERTGTPLRLGEIGCLLSHRKIWSIIKETAQHETDSFLILESDR